MRRDTIFYKLFKQFPGLLFELIEQPPPQAQEYQFQSVEVKESSFRIDGVFLPPDNTQSKVVFFAEVQFQKDEDLYYRFSSELWLFLYRHSIRYDDWLGVIIFPSRNLEPSNLIIHRSMLNGGQLQRIYLDELGELEQQPLGLGLMLLTVKEGTEAVAAARFLMSQAQAQSQRAIIDLITTIIVYKFTNLNQREIQAMLGLEVEEPLAIREAKAEAEISLILRQLNRKFGIIPDKLSTKIQQLSLEQLDAVGEALLDFSTINDLQTWLENQSQD